MWDRLYHHCHLASMDPARIRETGAEEADDFAIIPDAAIAIEGGRIRWLGPRKNLPQSPEKLARQIIACDGRWITPALIDCHTHLIFGGNRVAEFNLRLKGIPYAEIAKQGGGIAATVRATRSASEESLLASALQRLDLMQAEGLGTIEIKSGYGLDRENELKMLRVMDRIQNARTIRISRSFLGAHALPPDHEGDHDSYIDWLCDEMIPLIAAAHLADAVDGFCESIGFSPAQIDRLFRCARAHGLAVRLHAEQLSHQGGAALAARHGALSADHLEYLKDEDAKALAEAGTVAVLLPGAFYTLRETRLPPIAALKRHGVPMAIASDCNPGSSPLLSPLITMNMATTLFQLSPADALAGMTRQAARALGLQHETGMLREGFSADLAIWSISHPAELSYWIGASPLHAMVLRGEAI
ncbi:MULTISPECIES: imidazolonepropionase [unclassified Iodidimonas]|jgi:imidazolonepropionase|uniref:imidazolonepropionase n=2 Tax=Iodidimonas TaxID=2066486 RepID=UPI0024825D95|nr:MULTISPECIES: imidazolonepropionase [unclassified Iodidimonas]